MDWRTTRVNRPELGAVAMKWTASTPLRIAEDRRQALVELDALVALMLGVTADQLCIIYRTIPVLYGYDHKDYAYDVNGRLVPNSVLSVWRKKATNKRRRADRYQPAGTPISTSSRSAPRPRSRHARRVRRVRATAGGP